MNENFFTKKNRCHETLDLKKLHYVDFPLLEIL